MEIVEAARAAGVVGAGGAGFPTDIKLNTKVECFIVNAAECEPLIETDKYLCRTFPDRIVETVEKIAKHLGASKAVIALKNAYETEIAALQKAIKSRNSFVEVFLLGVFYPAGDEQTIIQQVTGRSVPERGLPSDVGCVVDNVGTVLNLADALEGKAVTDKYLSVVGEVEKTMMLHVPIGTPIRECIRTAKPLTEEYAVILGGPMMGKPHTDTGEIDLAVVTKTTGNIMVLPKDHYLFKRATIKLETMRKQTKSACIQCKMCTDLCPRYLIGHQIRPNQIMREFWKEETVSDNEQYGSIYGEAANCCSCGVCEMFACPMGLSPRKVNDYVKGELRKRQIQVPRNEKPVAREFADIHKTQTRRLIARLGLSKYRGKHPDGCMEYEGTEVFIPCQQHIGKPARIIVKEGDTVLKGDLIAEATQGLSANIHASMSGIITEVTESGVRIRRGKE